MQVVLSAKAAVKTVHFKGITIYKHLPGASLPWSCDCPSKLPPAKLAELLPDTWRLALCTNTGQNQDAEMVGLILMHLNKGIQPYVGPYGYKGGICNRINEELLQLQSLGEPLCISPELKLEAWEVYKASLAYKEGEFDPFEDEEVHLKPAKK